MNKYYVGNGFLQLGLSPNIFLKIGGNILQIKVSDIEMRGSRVIVDVYSYKKSGTFNKNAKEFISFLKHLNPIGIVSPVNNIATLRSGERIKCYSFFGRTFIYNRDELAKRMAFCIGKKQTRARKYYLALMHKMRKFED